MTRLLRLTASLAAWATFAVARSLADRRDLRRYGEWVAEWEREHGAVDA